MVDHTPTWLKKKTIQPPPWHNEPIEHEVDLKELTEYLAPPALVAPRETYWTLASLREMKESLLRQIDDEIERQNEITQLKEECANLAHGLDWLRLQRNKTVSFP